MMQTYKELMKLRDISSKIISTKTFDIIPEEDIQDYMQKNPNEKLIEVDDNIAYAICVLNKKGYKTEFCCEGHYKPINEYSRQLMEKNTGVSFTPGIGGYIAFSDGIMFPFESQCPLDWGAVKTNEHFDEELNVKKGYWITLYANISEEGERDEALFQREKLQSLSALYDWVESLPDRSGVDA